MRSRGVSRPRQSHKLEIVGANPASATNSMKKLFLWNGYKFDIQTCKFDDAIWFFGCSFVHGYLLEDHQTAPKNLEKIIGIPVINLGISGGNVFNIQHNLSVLTASYRPRAVVIAWPKPTRWVDPNGFNWGPWMLDSKYDHSDLDHRMLTEYKSLIETDEISRMTDKSIRAVKEIIKFYPVVEFNYAKPHWSYLVKTHEIQVIDLASDGHHPGPNTNIKVAEWVAEQLTVLGVTK